MQGNATRIFTRARGQGIVEYVLIFALVAFGAMAGMNSIAVAANSMFTAIAGVFGQYIS